MGPRTALGDAGEQELKDSYLDRNDILKFTSGRMLLARTAARALVLVLALIRERVHNRVSTGGAAYPCNRRVASI